MRVSENNNSWFHCGRCGSLFQSLVGEVQDRTCSECGRSPSLGMEAAPQEPAAARPAVVPDPFEREKHTLRKRKKNYFMAKLLVGWSLFLFAIVGGARLIWSDDPSASKASALKAVTDEVTEEEGAFINQVSAECNQSFTGFLVAGTPEERNQFVLSPITTASRMARFYGMNPMVNIDPGTLTFVKSAVLDLPGGRALETLWKTSEGRELDAVFVKERDEWRLDWDHFVRYSDFPWALFLAGSGDPSGEFRLLARERLAEERKTSETISVVLYAPRFGSVSETGFQSPEFLIKRDSENGRLLEAAFKLEREGKRVFGVKIPEVNPEGLIRIRAKIRRGEQGLERRFELEKIIACHWYHVDEPGVTPVTPEKE
jgi:hypothetical protein